MRAAPGAGNQRELLVKFKVHKFLGKGSYGSVFQVQRLSDNQSYALKVCMQVSAPAMCKLSRAASPSDHTVCGAVCVAAVGVSCLLQGAPCSSKNEAHALVAHTRQNVTAKRLSCAMAQLSSTVARALDHTLLKLFFVHTF